MAQEQLFADDYKVSLDVFEGPLDLLLYLIRREELDIYDIPLERVTTEYMAFLDNARSLDLDIAGEFIVMAATLMVIKSRMLLPVSRRVAEGGEEEWVDPRLDLVRQLIEYKKFKDAAIRLETMEALAANAFDYGGGRPKFEKTKADALGALANLDLYDLLTAFQEVLARANEVPDEELKGARFSVPEKMDSILERTRREGQVSFLSLFDPETAPKGEIIVTFLALLELLRQHVVIVYQNAAFHEITILPSRTLGDDVKLEKPDDYE